MSGKYTQIHDNDKVYKASRDYHVVEITKRDFDKKYNFWLFMTKSMLSHYGVSPYAEHLFLEIGKPYLKWGEWVLYNVFNNKKSCTEYCKKTYGMNCFKNTDYNNITYL